MTSSSRAAASVGSSSTARSSARSASSRGRRSAKTESEQVVRLRQSIVEADRSLQRLDRCGDVAIAIVGKAQLVDDARRAIVQAQTALVVGGRSRVLAHGGMSVAEQFERTRSAWGRARRPRSGPARQTRIRPAAGTSRPASGGQSSSLA